MHLWAMLTAHCTKRGFCNLPLIVLKVRDGKEPKIAVSFAQKTNVLSCPPTLGAAGEDLECGNTE